MARRGSPAEIYSYNGTNFQGAREEIRELQKLTESSDTNTAIEQFSSIHQIHWHHMPPRAPHFGGLWEAAVKAMKLHLRKTISPHHLRWDELYTVLTQAEAKQPPHRPDAQRRNFRRLLPDSRSLSDWETSPSTPPRTSVHGENLKPQEMGTGLQVE